MSRSIRRQMVLRLAAVLGGAWVGAHTQIGLQATPAASFIKGNVDVNASRSSTNFNTSNLMPGDVRYEEITISNDGSLDFRYTLTAHATNPDGKNLAGQLDAEARKVNRTCDAASFVASTDAIAPASKLDVVASTRERMLGAGTSETVCFRVSMPTSLGNAYQAATTTTTFKIDAIQAVANS